VEGGPATGAAISGVLPLGPLAAAPPSAWAADVATSTPP